MGKEEMKTGAKRKALMKMKRALSEGMAGRLGDPKAIKATVIAKDEEGLEEGLEKAKEILEAKEDMMPDLEGLSREELIEMLKKKMS